VQVLFFGGVNCGDSCSEKTNSIGTVGAHRDAPPDLRRRPKCKPDTWGTRILLRQVWATLYDGVGSVKRHVDCASRQGLVFFIPERIFFLSRISTKARFVNLAVNLVPPTIYSVTYFRP